LKKNNRESLPPVNEEIRVRTVQLINQNGENIGAISRDEALKLATEVQLDLVMIAPKGAEGMPVVKIMDFGKVLYEKKKKLAEAKKRQKIVQVKELKFRPKIGEHDLLTKMKRGVEFLKAGKHLKITLMFRGREIATKYERGTELFDRIKRVFREEGLLDDLVIEKESKAGQFWFRIYYLKSVKQ